MTTENGTLAPQMEIGEELHVILPGEPPSVNSLYVNIRGRGRRLSDVGAQWKNSTKGLLAAQNLYGPTYDPNRRYRLKIIFYLKNIENKGWPKTAKTRFRRIDISNLVKIIEDSLAEATGVDDSNNMALHIYKECDPENPRVEIIWLLF